jgi:hypothetical protein
MDPLPPPEEREELLARLASLIDRRGYEPFVTAHVVQPKPAFFPDVWTPDVQGAARVAQRLLGYAALGHLRADVSVYRSERDEAAAIGVYFDDDGRDAIATFEGIEDCSCLFTVSENQLAYDDAVVATLCHEVAHAYREQYGVADVDRDLDEENTDLTAVFLGFGVLLANNAEKFRKEGWAAGAMVYTRWSHSRSGYLPPQGLCWLLAAQVVARQDPGLKMHVLANLDANPAASFRAACKELEKDLAGLLDRLHIPPQEEWPEAVALDELTRPIDIDFESAGEEAQAAAPNGVQPVFTVEHSYTARHGLLGAVLGVVIATVFVIATGIEDRTTVALLFTMIGAVLGGLHGRSAREERCASCNTRVSFALTTCPGCGGTFSGEIADASRRLEAEERYERAARRRAL